MGELFTIISMDTDSVMRDISDDTVRWLWVAAGSERVVDSLFSPYDEYILTEGIF